MDKTLKLHKALQKYICELLPKNEGIIEQPFPGHFADIAWEREMIIFEIQCSPIPIEVVVKRNNDYTQLGFSVVWILHQKTFNKKYVTKSEYFLRKNTCYYTNFTLTGRGYVYDQLEHFNKNIRIIKSSPLQVDISKPFRKKTQLTFKGDKFHQKPDILSLFENKKLSTNLSIFKKILNKYDSILTNILKKISSL